MSRKNKKEIYLVGFECEKIVGCKLPTNALVLSLFFYKFKTLKRSVFQSATDTVNDVHNLWSRAKIPTKRIDHCVDKLKLIFNEWKKLAKSWSRKKSPTQKKKRAGLPVPA